MDIVMHWGILSQLHLVSRWEKKDVKIIQSLFKCFSAKITLKISQAIAE